MGDIVRRGTRDNPKFYSRYVDVDGRRKMRLLKGARTKAEAQPLLSKAELRVTQGKVGMEPLKKIPTCGVLMDEWLTSLTNRNARDDRTRFMRHVRPAFADKLLNEVQQISVVMAWLDRQAQTTNLTPASIRHNLNLLSRFLSWAIDRGHATINPVRMIPVGRRPQPTQKRDTPWLKDDAVAMKLMALLPEPINLMFYLGNRSGLRTGELAGLRMSDMDYLKDGTIRVRHSYDRPLKEDKHCTGKMKWVPAPDDYSQFLGLWLKRRLLQGAQPEDLVFPCPSARNSARRLGWKGYRKEFIEACWDDAKTTYNKKCAEENRDGEKVEMTWYQATRHSNITRKLEEGATLDEVSESVGHSSPVVTKQYYDHHIRRKFSPVLTRGFRKE
jgi:integrase